jgi:hypothetical protein
MHSRFDLGINSNMFESRQFESKHNLFLSRKSNYAMGTEPIEDDKTQHKSRCLLYACPTPRTYYSSLPCAVFVFLQVFLKPMQFHKTHNLAQTFINTRSDNMQNETDLINWFSPSFLPIKWTTLFFMK